MFFDRIRSTRELNSGERRVVNHYAVRNLDCLTPASNRDPRPVKKLKPQLSSLIIGNSATSFTGTSADVIHRCSGQHCCRGQFAWACSDNATAARLYQQAKDIWHNLVYKCGQTTLVGYIAWAQASRALSLRELSKCREARREARQAVKILRAEADKSDAAELHQIPQWSLDNLRGVL